MKEQESKKVTSENLQQKTGLLPCHSDIMCSGWILLWSAPTWQCSAAPASARLSHGRTGVTKPGYGMCVCLRHLTLGQSKAALIKIKLIAMLSLFSFLNYDTSAPRLRAGNGNLKVLHEKIYWGPNDSKIYAILNIKIKEVLSLPCSQDSKIVEAQTVSERFSNSCVLILGSIPTFSRFSDRSQILVWFRAEQPWSQSRGIMVYPSFNSQEQDWFVFFT